MVLVKNLSSLRGFSAILVVLYHFQGNYNEFHQMKYNLPLLNNGKTAVLIFFVLSGFLMSLTSQTRPIRDFYSRRMLRIFPMYLAVTCTGFLIWSIGNYMEVSYVEFSGYSFLFALLCLPQVIPYYFKESLLFVEILWSIGVEIWFYALFPLIRRFNHHSILLGLFIVLCLDFLLHWYTNYMVYFFAGILIHRFDLRLTHRISNIVVATFILRLFFFGLNITEIELLDKIINLMSVSVFIVALTSVGWNLDNIKLFKWLGDISFALYLLHPFGLLGYIYFCKTFFLVDCVVVLLVSLFLAKLGNKVENIMYKYAKNRFFDTK